ncbi:MAG: hypothetical protein J6U63_01260 [Clostridia bacterium]|nr:hypothetical protein [Clostridia bacterium]
MNRTQKRRIVWITAAVIVVIAAAVLIIHFLNKDKTDSKTEDTAMDYFIQVDFDDWQRFVDSDLFEKALGEENWETGEWKPLTDRLYAFDAEVFDYTNMYTLFLQGVQSIARDLVFSDIEEDLSGMTEELTWPENPYEPYTDGVRSVSFKCNGHAYSLTLTSMSDWFNVSEFMPFINQVLEKEKLEKRLWFISDGADQMIAVLYDTRENAQSFIHSVIN